MPRPREELHGLRMYTSEGWRSYSLRHSSASRGSTKWRGTRSKAAPCARRMRATLRYSLSLRPSSQVPGKWFTFWKRLMWWKSTPFSAPAQRAFQLLPRVCLNPAALKAALTALEQMPAILKYMRGRLHARRPSAAMLAGSTRKAAVAGMPGTALGRRCTVRGAHAAASPAGSSGSSSSSSSAAPLSRASRWRAAACTRIFPATAPALTVVWYSPSSSSSPSCPSTWKSS
mmetsp:Transcript_15052/g.28925  ORF Transcript_15052/g.28925 Transcript_15052/m.28925 type:complete len:230 (-) Transcript_15052:426-1115(-)